MVAGVKMWTPKTHTTYQTATTIKEEYGRKPVLLVKGPGSKWRNALLPVSAALTVRVGRPSLPALTACWRESVGWPWAGESQTRGPGSLSVCPSQGLAAAPSVPAAVYLVRSNVCSPARPLILKTREWLWRITYFCLETSQGREWDN